MAEGLGPAEVAKEISEHAKHGNEGGISRHDRRISIVEAALLAIVALTAAWSGYASAKWSTESRLSVAKSSAVRNQANLAELEGLQVRTTDASMFNAWYSAHVVDNTQAEAVAVRRMRPEYRVAFLAWRATDPDHNPNAPGGPQNMPQYKVPEDASARALNAEATKRFDDGSKQGEDGDNYVRITVYLASVLFLVGISTQFPIRAARYTLIGLGIIILVFSVTQLLTLPIPN
jgi:hypothetical protein